MGSVGIGGGGVPKTIRYADLCLPLVYAVYSVLIRTIVGRGGISGERVPKGGGGISFSIGLFRYPKCQPSLCPNPPWAQTV